MRLVGNLNEAESSRLRHQKGHGRNLVCLVAAGSSFKLGGGAAPTKSDTGGEVFARS